MCVCVCVCVCVFERERERESVQAHSCVHMCVFVYISMVSDQNGISLLYIVLEMHHSGQEASIYMCVCIFLCVCVSKTKLMVITTRQKRRNITAKCPAPLIETDSIEIVECHSLRCCD